MLSYITLGLVVVGLAAIGDLRDTARILAQAGQLLDLAKPVAVTLLTVLHAIPDDDDPYAIVATLMDAVPAGSYLAISHGASDLTDQGELQDLLDSRCSASTGGDLASFASFSACLTIARACSANRTTAITAS
jgi:hypothetical protein